ATAIVIAIGVILNAFAEGPSAGSPVVGGVVGVLGWATLLMILVRRGALAGAFVVFTSGLLTSAVPAPPGAWYGYAMWAPVTFIAVITIFAFYTALAGRPIFREAMLET
ncbi:MAG TPA: hypothetical protein VFV54_03395, partial [Thermoanaerobaculia bacterium]|nr:hypothetical protein [Thermoanaerobaculia bacterium]